MKCINIFWIDDQPLVFVFFELDRFIYAAMERLVARELFGQSISIKRKVVKWINIHNSSNDIPWQKTIKRANKHKIE